MNQSRPIAEVQRSSARPQRLLPLPIALALSTMPLIVAVGIAFLWPPTYGARAIVRLEPRSPAATRALTAKNPLEVAERLQAAALEASELPKWTAALGPAAPADRVKGALRVLPEGERSYAVEFRWRKPDQVEQTTNAVARQIAERAASALGISPEPVKRESDLDRRTRELAAFVAAHPELALDQPQREPSGEKLDDVTQETLKKERARLERAVAEAERRPKTDSDNPYVDPAPRVEELRARLAHVRKALATYDDAAKKKAPQTTVSPALQAEWRALVKALAEARKNAEQSPVGAATEPALTAHVATLAARPGRPEKPNRPVILGMGTVVSLGLGGVLTAIAMMRSAPRVSPSGRPQPLHPQQRGLQPGSDPPPPGQPVLDPVQRQSSRPPPGAGAYAMSVNKPDSDPPPAELLGPAAAQRSKTPPEHQAPIQPAPMLAPAPPVAAQVPFGQIPWMEGKQAVEPARPIEPARPVEPEPRHNQPAAARATNGAGTEQPARRPSHRPRGPMKRTTTLIHGSMIQPDGSPAAVEPHRLPAIDVEAEVVPPSQGPMPAAPTTALAVRTPQPPRPSVVTVASASAYWKPPVTRSPSPWLWVLRDELCAMAMERALGRCFVVMITSGGGARQAKSEAVAHLSMALAETGHPRILLMEGEFDRPAVHDVMGVEMPRSAGFSQQMHNRIHSQASGGWVVVECLPTLHVLAEGRMRSPGLLHSFQFEGAVNDLRQRYEIIVIDGPPLSVNTDMRALEAVVDGVVVVLRSGDREPTPVERALFGKKLLKIVTVDQLPPPNARS